MTLKCAFLSTDNLDDFFVYDDLVKPYLNEMGWHVEDVSWRDSTADFNAFDLVIVRSPWDYQDDVDAFNRCLLRIDQSKSELQNSLGLMQWNIAKSYLRDLQGKGVAILPTVWRDTFSTESTLQAFQTLDADEIIIKPVVSANADFTYRLSREQLTQQADQLESVFAHRPHMIQKFESSILTLGEISVFYFDGDYSHAIIKKPASGDFRVQEEHGGSLLSTTPDASTLTFAQGVIDALPEQALYARIDIIQTDKGAALIEVELIEPSLYFNMDEASPKRFAQAVHRRFGQTKN